MLIGLVKQREGKPLVSTEPHQTRVTTDETMELIQSVIKNTTRPSWMNTVPVAFGEAKTGTLKADEWRNLVNIHLPIALTLLWGVGSKHKRQEDADVLLEHLRHTMSLVQAVFLACFRTTTTYRKDRVLYHLKAYLNNLHLLHPDVDPLTNQHMSLHLPMFLQLFGPVHSWWVFPFERLIGKLQHLPTNHKFGMYTINKAGKQR